MNKKNMQNYSLFYFEDITCDICSSRGAWEFFGDYLCSRCLIDELMDWEKDPDDRDISWAHRVIKELKK